MVFNEKIMIPLDGNSEGLGGWFIVHVPEWCESEFEIAHCDDGEWFSNSEQYLPADYIKAYLPIEQYF